MKLNRVAAALAASLVVGGGFSSAVYAQVEAPAVQAPNVTKAIRLKNVSPIIMAWWLDPVNKPEPVEFRILRQPWTDYEAPKKASPGAFVLPKGVKTVVAIDAQKALMVLGTEAGIAELEETIKFLDRPLRRVEIEARFVEVDEPGIQELGFNFGPDIKINEPGVPEVDLNFGPNVAGKFAVSSRRGTGEETLQSLVAQGRAKVLNSSQVTTINNVEAFVSSPIKRPVVLGYRDENGNLQELFDPAAPVPAARFPLGVSFQLNVTPTINNDDTVTLLLSSTQVLQVPDEGKKSASQHELSGLFSIINAFDAGTVALRGLSSRFLATLGTTKPNSTVLMLVTPRIVRRTDEVAAQPVVLRR